MVCVRIRNEFTWIKLSTFINIYFVSNVAYSGGLNQKSVLRVSVLECNSLVWWPPLKLWEGERRDATDRST